MLLKFTPFGHPDFDLIKKKLPQKGLTIYFIEIKYPLIQFGRLLTSLALTWFLSTIIISPFVQDNFKNLQITYWKTEQVTEIKTDNWLKDMWENNRKKIEEAPKFLESEFWKVFWFEVMVGKALILPRFAFLYFFIISPLYFLTGNSFIQLEKKVSKQLIQTSNLVEDILNILLQNSQSLTQKANLSNQEIISLQEISMKVKKGKLLDNTDSSLLTRTYTNLLN